MARCCGFGRHAHTDHSDATSLLFVPLSCLAAGESRVGLSALAGGGQAAAGTPGECGARCNRCMESTSAKHPIGRGKLF